MSSDACIVLSNVQDTCSPLARLIDTELSPASKPPAAPIVTVLFVAPVQTMFVMTQPVGTVSVITRGSPTFGLRVGKFFEAALVASAPGAPASSSSVKFDMPPPVAVYAKSWALFGMAFFVMVIEPARVTVIVKGSQLHFAAFVGSDPSRYPPLGSSASGSGTGQKILESSAGTFHATHAPIVITLPLAGQRAGIVGPVRGKSKKAP